MAVQLRGSAARVCDQIPRSQPLIFQAAARAAARAAAAARADSSSVAGLARRLASVQAAVLRGRVDFCFRGFLRPSAVVPGALPVLQRLPLVAVGRASVSAATAAGPSLGLTPHLAFCKRRRRALSKSKSLCADFD